MFDGNKPLSHIANVLNCDLAHVSQTVSNYLNAGKEDLGLPKESVSPFVLITKNQEVLDAYNNMVNRKNVTISCAYKRPSDD